MDTHTKNGTAGKAIHKISGCVHSMILHVTHHWKNSVSSELFSMAVEYTTYLDNHLPNDKGIIPVDLFTEVTIPHYKLHDCHVWGSPVYVLDPKLQLDQKLPYWNYYLVMESLLVSVEFIPTTYC